MGVIATMAISLYCHPNGDSISYDLGDDELSLGIDDIFVDVIGNIEIIILVTLGGLFDFAVSDVGGQGRGGFVFVGPDQSTDDTFTDEIRNGDTDVTINTNGGQ